MNIDTEIRHVTKPGANLFLELGLPPGEAKRLLAASRKQVNDKRKGTSLSVMARSRRIDAQPISNR